MSANSSVRFGHWSSVLEKTLLVLKEISDFDMGQFGIDVSAEYCILVVMRTVHVDPKRKETDLYVK